MTIPRACASRSLATVALAATLALVAGAAAADLRLPALDHGPWKQECGSCHVAYPPQLLSAGSWRALLAGLGEHFGVDASLEPAVRDEILRFLEEHASGRDTSAAGKPLLRITETRWFRSEHSEELPAGIWQTPEVRSPANCGACHTGAERGDYSERTLRVPGGGTHR